MATKYDEYAANIIKKKKNTSKEEEKAQMYAREAEQRGYVNPNYYTTTAYSMIRNEVDRLRAIRNRNVGANLRTAANNFLDTEVTRTADGRNQVKTAPNYQTPADKLKKGLYTEVQNRLKPQIENELNIINKQGRAEDDPAVSAAQKKYAELMTKYNAAQGELAKLPQPMYVGKDQAGQHLDYSPEVNKYIRKYQEMNAGLAQRMTEKKPIPKVASKEYAAWQHAINAPESTESADYVDWLIEGRDIGLYNTQALNAMLSGVKNKTVVDEYLAKDDSEKGGWLNPTHQDVRYWDQAMEWNKLHPEGEDAEALQAKLKYYQDALSGYESHLSGEQWDNRNAIISHIGSLRTAYSMPKGELARMLGAESAEQGIYDAIFGDGEYEKLTFGNQAIMNDVNRRVNEAWYYIKEDRDEDAYQLLTGDTYDYADAETMAGNYRDMIADTEGRLNYYKKVSDYKAPYQEYAAENSAEDDEQYDRGKYNPNDYRFTLAERGSNNVDDIFSFIIGGNEYRSYVDATKNGWGDKPPDVSKDYKGAMLLQPDEINIFKNLYEAGKKDEASAFLDGLQFAINNRVAPFEELKTREEARAFPILNSIFAQAANVADTALGAMTAVDSALTGMGVDFGPNDTAKDPYSIAYAPARYSEAVQDEIADMLGPQAGKLYLQSMNSIRNVINGVLMYKLGVPQGLLPTATLATFGTQIYQESMYKNLKEYNDFDKASAMSTLEVALEIGEELLPIETMFATAGTNIFLRIIANMLSEGGEEFAGSTVGEVLKGMFTGRNSWEQRKDQIYAEGGYMDDNGNWIKVGRNRNGLAEANKQAMREWGQNIVQSTEAGFFGGGFGAVYGTVTNANRQRNIGAAIQNRENLLGQQTGPDQLLKAAMGMDKSTESYKIAEKIGQKVAKGGSASNYQLGKLATAMATESNDTVAGIVSDTVEARVREQLASEGVDQGIINRVAPIVAKAVSRGPGSLGIQERLNLATSRNAIDLLKSYMTNDGSLAETVTANPAGAAALNVRQTVSRLMNGNHQALGFGFATRAVEESREAAVVATEQDIADAEGELSGDGTDVIVNNKVAQVTGRKDGKYTVRYADDTEETVDAGTVVAANPALATLIEFGEREDSHINDEAFNTILEGIRDNAEMDGGQYVNDAVNAYLRYRMLGQVKDSKLNAKTLDNIRTAAETANARARELAAEKGAQQDTVVPGKGTLTYDGVKFGEDGWRQKVKSLGAEKAEEASALGQMITMMGNRVKLINDEKNPGLFGWEDSTGEIVLNLAAKDSAGTEYAKSRNLLTIAAHELTHWMEQNSPEAYQQLRQFVFDTLRKQGGEYAVESLVLQTMEDYRKAALTNKDVQPVDLEGAMAEVVANACDNILSNRKLAEDLQAENPNLWQTVKGFVQDFVGRMRSATRNMSDTRESRLMKQAGEEVADQLEEYWMAGIREGRQPKQGAKAAGTEQAARAEAAQETAGAEEKAEPTNPGQLTPEESIHPESGQFSVAQMAEAANLGMVEGDETLTLYMESPNGKKVKGLDENRKWVKVDGVKVKITPEMIRETPVGMLIDMGLSDQVVNKDGMTQKETARKMFADLMNMCARYRDNNLIWEIAGSEFAETFSALKNNSDPQYRNTVDFGTICSKTQGIVDVLSATMRKRIEDTKRWNAAHPNDQRVFSGLTRQDIMMVYNQTHNANLSVPCPVCYVFSRWMGVPSLLGQMNRFQHNYVVTEKDENGQNVYDENGDAVIDWDATQKAANDYIKSALKKYGSKDAITNTKTKLQTKIGKREEKLDDARKKVAQLQKESRQAGLTADKRGKYEERIKAAQAVVDKLNKDIDDFTKQLEGVEAYNWVTQALCLQHTEGQKTVNDMDADGNYIVDRTFRLTPEEILFDLNRTGEFAGYTKNWRYRTTRGAGMGKAIMPYSGASIGDLVHGDAARWSSSQNPFLTMNEAEARRAFENAKKRVRKQNLVGGQRFQSTSDFRPEWGLDYVMSFLEMQALGSKVQMYTKVREAVDFLGSIGADVNQSIMASGNGWHIATEEEIRKAKTDKELASRMGETYDKDGVKHTYVMDFSDVTGMEYNTAKTNSKKYNNVQMILVGMNDIHIRLALANEDIDFVIPWHSSGNSKDVLQQLVKSVDETLTESDDYTKFQEDTKKKGRTAKQEALWDARVKLLQEGADKLTQKEIDTLNSNKYTRELYRRFAVEGVDPDCYGVTLPKDQAAKIFPYEYWDKNSTRENADVNGRRFVEYCEAMGLTPRFAMFKDEPGYWKLLIDRKMFDNNVLNEDGTVKEYGKYREQQVVDVTKAEIGQLPTEATAKYGSGYRAETERAIEQSTAALRQKYDLEPGYNPYAEDEEQTEKQPAKQLSIAQDSEGRELTPEQVEYFKDSKAVDSQGRLKVLYHGTISAGFTVFEKADGYGYFFTDDKNVAQTYSDSDKVFAPDRNDELDDLVDYENPEKATKSNYAAYLNLINPKIISGNMSMWNSVVDSAGANLKAWYELTPEQQIKIADNMGITLSEAEERGTFGEYGEFEAAVYDVDSMTIRDAMSTREWVDKAKDEGYDGVIFRNIEDEGEYSGGMPWVSTVYVAFSPEQIKSINNTEPTSSPDIRFSIDQGDMDVRVWMQKLTDGSVSTAQEKAMLKQYQTLAKDLDVERGLLLKRRQKLAEMLKKPNTSAYDRKKIRDLQATIEAKQNQLNRKEEKLAKMTSQEGFARLMYDQSRIMNELVNGRTVEDVQQMIDDMSGELDMITSQMGEREKEIADLKQKAQNAISALEKVPGAEAAANQLRAIVGQMGLNQKNLQRAKTRIGEVAENAKVAGVRTGNIQKAVDAAIAYNNKLTEQSEAATWQEERRKLVHTLRSEHTQELLKQQQEFREKIAKDRAARKMQQDNMALRRKVNLNINRVRALLMRENAQKNIPEHMKPIAREMLRRIVVNDLAGRKITGLSEKELAETKRVLDAWEGQDGKWNPNSLQTLDEGVQDVLYNALEDLASGIEYYNGDTKGKGLQENLDNFNGALTEISNAVSTITSIINNQRQISLDGRKMDLMAMAYKVQEYTGGKRAMQRGGKAGLAYEALRKAVTTGNITPEYFFKMLKNAGLNDLWEEYHRAENRNGLELQKAKDKLDEIAQKYGYKAWDTDKRLTVKLESGDVQMTLGQIMSLYATWKREHTLGPAMSNHLGMGGFYVEEFDPRDGFWKKSPIDLKAHRVNENDMKLVQSLMTEQQQNFVDEIVGYMSKDMSDLGNEASMAAYGIKMYKEAYYFPFKMWDGIRSRASNDSGSAAAANDRAFHPSFSKSRLHGANNAVMIGDFMTTAADHIVGMINYATMGLANENLQKVLNAQVEEGDRLDTMTKRNVRAVLTEAYGKAAMDYLAKLQEQLNGGAVRVEKSLYDRALTLFRKNAVAGSLSVALQQPLSFLRAGMMINPKYLTSALAREYWRGSYQERMAHSGVSVIKDMGRFDMGFGAGAREFITPEGKEGKIRKAWDAITDKATILPELMDRWTWNRMWVAVKAEQHDLHPEMDIKSDEFLNMTAKRFNDIVRKTQVYDSVLVKSENMRSQNPFVKSITSFMAEPTLTLNVLADAMQNIGEKGGKTRAIKALAIFATSAMAQAAVKALMSSGRSPDDKKTWEENFLYRFYANAISEIDPLNLVSGYNDLVTLLKEGKLEDDALGMAGKIAKAFQTAGDMFKEGAEYKDYENGVGQIVQLFTQLPAKNIMRDLRAMYNFFIGKPYANRETSAAVLKYQAKEARMTADNLVGIISAALGEAGYKTNNTAYYGRLFEAKQSGNTGEAEEITEYLTLGKGVEEETIQKGLRAQAKDKLEPAEATEWMLDEGLLSSTSTITTQYREGKITAEEAEKLYRKADPEMKDEDIWFKIDKIDWEKKTGTESNSDYYYRLGPALETNRSADINDAIKLLMKHGRTQKNLKEQVNRILKDQYLAADNAGKVKIRNEMHLAYKAIGLKAEDADKTIEGWKKDK